MASFSGQTIAAFASELVKTGLFAGLTPPQLLRSVQLLSNLSEKELARLAQEATVHSYETGTVIVRQSEYTHDTFLLLSGLAERTLVTERAERLSLGRLGPGALFGRLSLSSEGQNLATVTALERSHVIVLPPISLERLIQQSPNFAQALQKAHLEQTVGAALRCVPLFAEAPSEAIGDLTRAGRLRVFAKGDVVFEKGEQGDSLYLVVSGVVKVYVQERILAYLKSGAYFGEMALVKNEPRMASVAAVTDVEAFQIMEEDFQKFLASHGPAVESVRRTIQQREQENLELSRHPERMERLRFLENLMGAQDILAINLTRCIRCDRCVQTCARTRGQPRFERKGNFYGGYLIATVCRQCRDPACMLCKRNAIVRDKTGEIYIKDTCIGCGFCAQQCPYGNILIVEVEQPESGKEETVKRQSRKKAVKCDLCRHMDWPPCALNCPTGALARVAPEELFGKRDA